MKFVFFGYDFMLPAVRRLIADEHELCGVFTFECDNIFNFNRDLIALAEKLDIPVSLEPPSLADIERFIEASVQCFFAGGYLYKIPPVDAARAYAINLHPSLLPKGRGFMPTPHIIIDHPEASGFTIHKLSEAFDAGDILYQEGLPVGPRETVETLSGRIAERAPDALSRVMRHLPRFWEQAKPQNEAEASIFKMPSEVMRTLEWTKGTDHIDRTARAFGHYGCLARFDNSLWIVTGLEVWADAHKNRPGDVVSKENGEIIIAASDGFVRLKEFQKVQI
ncbi:MAG: methionyl-tRNA formyltransferase [Alphaproteobacteria bacterium]